MAKRKLSILEPTHLDCGADRPRRPSRRHVLTAFAGAVVGGQGAASLVARGGDEATAPPTAARPTLHVYDDYGWLRGFGIVPSWAARIEDAWWFYDAARMREEVVLTKQVHANCIRLWIEFTAWVRDPEKVTANFMDAVAAVAEQGMKAMPCLFNRWHDTQFDYGGTYVENLRHDWRQPLEYVKAIVAPLAADDRILAWDLCNEPQAADLRSEANRREFDWLSAIAATVRGCGAPAADSRRHAARGWAHSHLCPAGGRPLRPSVRTSAAGSTAAAARRVPVDQPRARQASARQRGHPRLPRRRQAGDHRPLLLRDARRRRIRLDGLGGP